MINIIEKLQRKLRNKIVLMSFASGDAAEEGTSTSFNRYIGVSPFTVLAINPTKPELETILGTTIENEIEYKGKDRNDKNQIRIDVWLKADPNWGRQIDATPLKASFFLSEGVMTNKDQTKVKIIDKYGETSWATKEEFTSKTVPSYAKRLIPPYRECYSGEEELIGFIKAWLNIPDSTRYKHEAWSPIEKLETAEASFPNVVAMVKGDLKILQSLVKGHKDYKVKACVGVKTTEDNKKYQDVFNRLFLKNSSNSYDRFEKLIKEAKENGAYANTEFSTDMLNVYGVEPTSFTSTTSPIPELTHPGVPKLPSSFPADPMEGLAKGFDTDTIPEVEPTSDLPW